MRTASTAFMLVGCAAIAGAQALQPTPTASARTFEVASIKPNRSGNVERTTLDGPQPGGRWIMTNRPVRTMIAFAYFIGQAEIRGLPSWAESERYDVIAKAEGEATVAEMRLMMRALLDERFGFQMHYETRPQPTYALMLARDDRALGPHLRKVELECATIFEQVAAGKMSLADVEVAPNGTRKCTTQSILKFTDAGAVRTLKSGGARLNTLFGPIGAEVGRPLVDKTGLEGYYEYTIEYAAPVRAPIDPGLQALGAPTVFTAIREQLGLKLVSEENDMPVLVVDRLRRPTED